MARPKTPAPGGSVNEPALKGGWPRSGARGYDRARDLARLVPLWPHEIADDTAAGRARLIRRLESALRAERRRGVSGHWSYDLARHAALLAAYRAERAMANGAKTPSTV